MPLDHLTAAMGQADSLAAMATLSLACVIAAGMALAVALQSWRFARDAQDAIDGAATLREGGSLVFGVASTEGEPAVTVRLVEQGSQWKHKGHWHHSWKETSREVRARPFHVVTGRGERVLVEPSENVFLVDELEPSARRGALERERTAALSDGEEVAVTGRLRRRAASGGAYRGSEGGWVLEPPARGPMIVTTKPLADRHRSWARFYAGVALGPIALLVVSNLLAYGGLYAFVLHGRPVVGTVRDHAVHVTHGRHGTHTSHELLVETSDASAWVTVTFDGYDRADVGAQVAAIETPERQLSLGSEPGFLAGNLVFPMIAGILFALGVWGARRKRLLWWEQKRVVVLGSGAIAS